MIFTFSVLDLFFVNFVEKNHLAFWCYLINLLPVYLQRLEASGFPCFNEKMKNLEPAIVVSGTCPSFFSLGYQPWSAIVKFLFKP